MKIQDIRAKKTEELVGLKNDLKKESLNLRFQQANGALKNTARRAQVKRELAQIETILASRSETKTIKEK